MDKKQEQFMQELLADFYIEAAEHLQIYLNGLLELEKNIRPADAARVVEQIFREIHSAKGAARAVNLVEIERVCQSLESVLASLKAGRVDISPPVMDTLHEAGDMIGLMLSDSSTGTRSLKGEDILNMVCLLTDLAQGKVQSLLVVSPPLRADSGAGAFPGGHPIDLTAAPLVNQQDLTRDLTRIPNDQFSPDKPAIVHERSGQQETVRISREKLTSLMIQAEEFIASKSMFRHFSNEMSGIADMYYRLWKQTENRLNRITSETGNDPVEMNDIRKWFRENARELHEHISRFKRMFGQYNHNTSRMIDELLLDIRKTLLVPFSTVLDIFPKMVRDLAKDRGKDVQLTIEGSSTEIDRRILEEIKDPLIHLIRNCIDHGIESKEARIKQNKPRQGRIEIILTRTQNKEIQIDIQDDGAGIDPAKVILSAIREGIISEESAKGLTPDEILQLVFQSGVSTSPLITDISGRGLGLAIVSEKIKRLGGQVSLKSETAAGTCFSMTLPLTLATFRGVLVRMGEHFVMIPLNSVEKVLRVKQAGIHIVENHETMVYENHHIPLFRMCDVLGFVSGRSKSSVTYSNIILISSGKKKIAFHVDEVVGEQEGIIKPLGGQLISVRHLSGATVLGNGKVVPVIDAYELLESTSAVEITSSKSSTGVSEEVSSPGAKIMVAEDSLTSRSLLRNLLETAGYEVSTAVDGWDAYTLLKQGGYDLVVSDIEMPRMNGFELTAKIRSEPAISSMPVVLVTALESAEDRQRGLEAGANAYIVKSSFEGSNLVSTVQRLI